MADRHASAPPETRHRRLMIAGLCALLLAPAATYGSHRLSRKQCERLARQIRRLQSRLRQGYTAKQGRRYRERMRELQLKRHRGC